MNSIWKLRRAQGFTLIELLVVIAIIGILASVVLASLGSARTRAKIARAQTELRSFHSAIELLAADTGKWPFGCEVGVFPDFGASPPSRTLHNRQAGLRDLSPDVAAYGNCEWTAGDLAKRRAPYIDASTLNDPWGNAYVLDEDYFPYRNCADVPEEPKTVVIYSKGPDGIGNYDCDDIFVKLEPVSE